MQSDEQTESLICHRIANELGIPVYQVREAAQHQFKFIKDTMKKGDFEAVRLRYFGIFRVDDYRRKKVEEKHGKGPNKGDTDNEG